MSKLNSHLQTLMPGLTAKVFRTFNASITLDKEVRNTPERGTVEEKILAYNRANRSVAVLCNHQRAAPKTHDLQMEKLDAKVCYNRIVNLLTVNHETNDIISSLRLKIPKSS